MLNVCYGDPVERSDYQPVDLLHQQDVCLSREYQFCPVYLRCCAQQRLGAPDSPSRSYLDFYGLREEPFSIVPLPRFMVQLVNQSEAYIGLRQLVDHHQGLGLLIGPMGVGKTLLCRALFEELQAHPRYVPTLLLTPAYRSEYALMGSLLRGWNVNPSRRRSLQDLEAAAYHFLVQAALEREKTLVLIVDEAQTLSYRLLRYVRKLLNWQERGEQLLQVILAGQPSLERKLERVPDLRDRAVVEFALNGMSLTDVHRMISQRLSRAGRRGELFTHGAVRLICQYAQGNPRRVIVLCLQSMWLAYQREERRIRADVVQTVADRLRAANQSGLPQQEAIQLPADWRAPVRRLTFTWIPRVLQQLWAHLTA